MHFLFDLLPFGREMGMGNSFAHLGLSTGSYDRKRSSVFIKQGLNHFPPAVGHDVCSAVLYSTLLRPLPVRPRPLLLVLKSGALGVPRRLWARPAVEFIRSRKRAAW